ncbi:hypothetical protein PEBR_10734 [Penicillium brasilianum]|uniref:Uncharacterized protein n=1 Tax=Penicillium brasilianum TaxID=104259 RepID=A0A1S9RUE9_PENBI|nr:hypothetical protein PEBR_10734 [Penicillium brasilianum]
MGEEDDVMFERAGKLDPDVKDGGDDLLEGGQESGGSGVLHRRYLIEEEDGLVDLALVEKEEQEEEAEPEKGGAGGHMQVPSFRCYRLDKAEIVTYRESRVTFRGIMIHCEANAIYTGDTCVFDIKKDEKTMNV